MNHRLSHRSQTATLAALLSLAAVFMLALAGSARGQATAQPAAIGQPAAAPDSTASRYTGEKISLNLKDVDLKDFFRLIHQISGLNVVVDSNVTGTVTVALDDVPWDQALDVVLMNNGLDKTLEGNVLRVARLETLSAQAESRAKLAQAQAASSQLMTVVRYLNFASAADMTLNNSNGGSGSGSGGMQAQGGVSGLTLIPGVATILKTMAPSILTRRGTVVADSRNNAVVVSDVASQIPVIEAVIDKLDHKARQVSIEARIVLTTSDVIHQLQGSLLNGLRNPSGSLSGGGATGNGSSAQDTPQSGAPTSSFPSSLGTILPTITQTAPSGFGAFAISSQSGKYLISAALAAAETNNKAKTISAPTIVTQNNIPGSVLQGTQIPVQTVVNNTVTTVYINATLTLLVTPQVTDDGHIFLNILVQNNSPGPVLSGTSSPEINTQAATTQVLVPDGGVVVFGGIKVTSNTKSVTQVPGLGSIPLIGNLFKSSDREEQQDELLFIVTPKILPS
jgi:type IV pilus assembly protein PilQ